MPDEYGELIGCSEMHSAPVVVDNADGYIAGANDYLAPAAEIQHEAKVDTSIRYYDNKPRFATDTEGESSVKITVSGVPVKLAAVLTGKPYDAARGIFIDTGDVSTTPWRTLSGQMDLGDGGYRFFQYLKGKFSLGNQEAQTREDKTTVKTIDLTYTAVVTSHAFTMPEGAKQSVKGVWADTTDAAFAGADDWYSQVQTPETLGAPGTLTMTSTPVAGATGVAASVKPVLTFSNAIAVDAVTLLKSDGTIVAANKSYDSTGKVLTLTPTSMLDSGASYTIVVSGIKDVYGQALGTAAIGFTTA